MTTHHLKCLADPMEALAEGRKTHEYRIDDRTPRYEVGDQLILQEYDPKTKTFSGWELIRFVTYVSRGPAYGIPMGYCVMSVSPVRP